MEAAALSCGTYSEVIFNFSSMQDGSSQSQPVLYHFGPGSGSGGSKERDSR